MSEILYRLKNVRKTYASLKSPLGFRKVSDYVPAGKCRWAEPPKGKDWRSYCGTEAVCVRECPICWKVFIEDLTIQRGERIALLGPSGHGKSTFLNMLALLHYPDADSEEFSFNPLLGREFTCQQQKWRNGKGRGVTPTSLRKDYMGFIFQAGYLTSSLSAWENLVMPARVVGQSAAFYKERARTLFERVNVKEHARHALPYSLSGGEYQRIAVARALTKDPAIIFADEPTGNLDPINGEIVMNLLTNWYRSKPTERTLFLVTHNIDFAMEYSDRVLVLATGQLRFNARTEDTSHDEISELLHSFSLHVNRE